MTVVVWFLWHHALNSQSYVEQGWLNKDGLLQSFARTEKETLRRLRYAQENTGVTQWAPKQVDLSRVS